jgi:hypothetical protein
MTVPPRTAADIAELPEKPNGWTKTLCMHMNFGSEGGAATYTVRNAEGEETPIGYQYDTRKGGQTGFSLPDSETLITWTELRAEWPKYLARTRSQEEKP